MALPLLVCLLFSPSAVAAEPLQIVPAKAAFQNFTVAGQIGAGPVAANNYYLKFQNLTTGASPFQITQLVPFNQQCTLSVINKVTVTFSPMGHPYPCIVFGTTPNPRIDDPSTIKVFPNFRATFPALYAGFNPPSYAFNGDTQTVNLSIDYRFFAIWLYDFQAAYNDVAGGAKPGFPPLLHTSIDPAAIGFTNAGENTALVYLTFEGL